VEKSIAGGVREALWLWGEAVTATAAAGVRVATRGDGDRRRRRANGMRAGGPRGRRHDAEETDRGTGRDARPDTWRDRACLSGSVGPGPDSCSLPLGCWTGTYGVSRDRFLIRCL